MKRSVTTLTTTFLFSLMTLPAFANCEKATNDIDASLSQQISIMLVANHTQVDSELGAALNHTLWLQNLAMSQEIPTTSKQAIARVDD